MTKPNPKLPLSKTDPVNHPAHYTQGSIECIDAIESMLGRHGFVAFLQGQIVKYTWRLTLKDSAIENAAKLGWYQQRLVAALAKLEA